MALAGLAFAACVQRQRGFEGPPNQEWPQLLARAQGSATEGRYARADSLLSEFTLRYAGSAEAAEAHYWRALYLLDPANAGASPRRAIGLFDEYLAARPLPRHHLEAATLRRVALLADSLSRPSTTASGSRSGEEVQRLREELRKTTEELERIKRRLSAPRP